MSLMRLGGSWLSFSDASLKIAVRMEFTKLSFAITHPFTLGETPLIRLSITARATVIYIFRSYEFVVLSLMALCKIDKDSVINLNLS